MHYSVAVLAIWFTLCFFNYSTLACHSCPTSGKVYFSYQYPNQIQIPTPQLLVLHWMKSMTFLVNETSFVFRHWTGVSPTIGLPLVSYPPEVFQESNKPERTKWEPRNSKEENRTKLSKTRKGSFHWSAAFASLQSSDLTLIGMLSDLDRFTSKEIPLWHEERL